MVKPVKAPPEIVAVAVAVVPGGGVPIVMLGTEL
jgi:hypothetical protein